MNDPRSLASMWVDYEALVVPSGAVDIARDALRTAFYGGAASLMHLLALNLAPGEEGTEADNRFLAAFQGELDGFAGDVAGRLALIPLGAPVSTLQPGATVEVALSSGYRVTGLVVEVTQFGVLINYTDQRVEPARAWTHWFHPTGRRKGDHDNPPVSFIDRFGARAELP